MKVKSGSHILSLKEMKSKNYLEKVFSFSKEFFYISTISDGSVSVIAK